MEDQFIRTRMLLGDAAIERLQHSHVAVFGLGDKENYEDYFCWAADLLSKKVQACGANLVCAPLKVDGEPDDNEAAVAAWAKAL